MVIVWERSNRSLPDCAGVSPGWKTDQVSSPEVGRLPEDEKAPGTSGTVVLGTAPEQATEVQIHVPASQGVEASQGVSAVVPRSMGRSPTPPAPPPRLSRFRSMSATCRPGLGTCAPHLQRRP